MSRTINRPVKTVALLIVPAVACLAACSSGGSGSSGSGSGASATGATGATSACLAKAQKILDPYEKAPSAFTVPKLSTSATSLTGKSLWFIGPIQASIIGEQAQGVQAAGKALGINVKVFDTQGTVSLENQGITEALAAKASGIFIDAIQTADVSAELGDVAAAHIPVVSFYEKPTTAASKAGRQTTVLPDETGTGNALGAEAAVLMKCSGTLVQMYSPAASESVIYKDSVASELQALCPSTCKQVTGVSSFTNTAADGPTAESAAARSQAALVVTSGDADVPYIEASLQQSGLPIPVLGASGSAPAMADLEKAGNPLKADMAPASDNFTGYLGMDSMLRLLEGGSPQIVTVPERLVTQQSLAASNNVVFPNLANYASIFLAAWKS